MKTRITSEYIMSKWAVSGRENADDLYAIEDHSLSEFFENEPYLYTVSDIKARFK
jgi:hypothetical protein